MFPLGRCCGVELTPSPSAYKVPNLAVSLIRALEVDSVYLLKSSESLADVLIQPDVRQFTLLDFAAYESIAEVVSQVGREQMAQWQEQQKSAG